MKRKTHFVCNQTVKRENKPTKEPNCYIPERIVCFVEKKYVEKHISCVSRMKASKKNTLRKLINTFRNE